MSTAKTTVVYTSVFLITLGLTYLALSFLFKANNAPQPVFLKVVGFWEPAVFNALKKEFQEKNPEITIEYEQRQKENYLPALKSDLTKEQTTPDLFWWHSGWGPELFSNLESLPKDLMTSSEYEKIFYPITKTDLQMGSSYKGFPLEIDGLALLYNKKIFAAANFTSPPTTWSSLRQTYGQALTMRDKERILRSAIALGSVNNVENFPEILGLFLLQNDVKFIKDKKLNILDNENSAGTNLVSDAIEGYIKFSKEDKMWDNTLPNSIDAFASGKTAMIILPASKIPTLLVKVKKENLTLDFGVAPVPQLPEANTVNWGSYWSVGVSKWSQNKKPAWKLAQFLVTPEALRTVFKLESQIYGLGRPYPRVDMAKEQTTHPYLAAYVAQAASAKSWYLHSDTFDQGLNDNVISEFTTFVAEIEKGQSVNSLLKNLATKLSPILQKYNLISTTPSQ